MDRSSYMSFVVRLWSDGASGEIRGEIEHIQSGRRWSFVSLTHALDFLRHVVDAPHLLAEPPDEKP
jgi:hypothetical protein